MAFVGRNDFNIAEGQLDSYVLDSLIREYELPLFDEPPKQAQLRELTERIGAGLGMLSVQTIDEVHKDVSMLFSISMDLEMYDLAVRYADLALRAYAWPVI